MSTLNPYEGFLDGRPVEAILASTEARLASLLDAIGPEKAELAPAPGKWSPAEIVCHLADCELAFAFRLRQTLAEENHVVRVEKKSGKKGRPAIIRNGRRSRDA